MKGPHHAHSDVLYGFDVLCDDRVVLRVPDLVCLSLNLVKDSRLYSEILTSFVLNRLALIARPGLPRTVDRVIMLLILLIFFLCARNACLRNVEIHFPVVTGNGKRLGFLVKSLIAEELRGSPQLHQVFPPSLFFWVFR